MRVTSCCPAHHLQGFQVSQQTARGRYGMVGTVTSFRGNRVAPPIDGQLSQLWREESAMWWAALIEIDNKPVWGINEIPLAWGFTPALMNHFVKLI